jgi:NADPH:quinone reductase-like Zn-dependent oxidoreductase
MRAVRLHEDGLKLEEIARPEAADGEVLVRVHAAAITRDELEWPTDRLPAIVSYELSGVVVDSGEEVFALTPFDRDGVAAEYAVVPRSVLAPKPASLSHVEAAALPMGGLSAWQGLVVHGGLKKGERVCITGATGGVGHLAVQLARALGAIVVAEGEPCDLFFDTAGRASGDAKRIVTIAHEVPNATYFIVEPNGDQLAQLAALGLRPEVDSTFALADFDAAFARSEARGKRGKVVLTGDGPSQSH